MQGPTSPRTRKIEGKNMPAKPATNEPVIQDMQAHERDYTGFTKLFTYGAIASFTIAMIVLFHIS